LARFGIVDWFDGFECIPRRHSFLFFLFLSSHHCFSLLALPTPHAALLALLPKTALSRSGSIAILSANLHRLHVFLSASALRIFERLLRLAWCGVPSAAKFWPLFSLFLSFAAAGFRPSTWFLYMRTSSCGASQIEPALSIAPSTALNLADCESMIDDLT